MRKYVVVKSEIDGKFRVMLEKDAPYGTCYSVADNLEDAIQNGARFLDIPAESIEVM